VIGVWDGPEEARRVGEEIEALQRAAAGSTRSRSWSAPSSRPASSRTASSPSACPTGSSAASASTSAPRSATRSPICASSPSPPTTSPSSASSTRPSAASATRRSPRSTRSPAPQGVPLMAAAAPILDTDELTAQARRSLGNLVGDFARWRPARRAAPSRAGPLVLDESGYTAMLQADRSAESAGRLENLAELTRAMEEYETLGAFLEHVSLVMDNDAEREAEKVTIMTIHAAKGLEFDTVFLAGWEEGVFPSQRALDEGGNASLEEERRLAYVAITRARRKCFILHAANRRIYGQWTSPSPRASSPSCPTPISSRKQHDRRREPVARQLVRARRPLRRRRPRHRPRPRLAARRDSGGFDATPAARDGSPGERDQPRQSRPRRHRASASASSTPSSATAWSPRSRATSSRSTSSMPGGSGCWTAS
jgi:DNA helicase-2/ATP-dependent DNA helicase PcrA